MTRSQRHELIKALLACNSIADDTIRSSVVRELPAELGQGITRVGSSRADVVGIVRACEGYKYGIDILIAIVREYDEGSEAFQGLEGVLGEIGTNKVLLPSQREEVIDLAGRILAPDDGTGLKALALQCLPKGFPAMIPDHDAAIVDNLASLPPARRGTVLHPALELVERLALLAERRGKPELRQPLQKIALDSCEVVKVPRDELDRARATLRREPPPGPRRLYLLIDFRPNLAQPDQYSPDAWLFEAGSKEPLGGEIHAGDPQPLDRLREELIGLVDRVVGPVRPEDCLTIELFLPRSLHRGDFDQWPASRPNRRGKFPRLGNECSVVVRCRERVEDNTAFGVRHRWECALHELCEGRRKELEVPVKWITQPREADYDTLYDELEEKKGALCLVVVTAPPSEPEVLQADVLEAAVETGVPWILCLRQRPVDVDAARAALRVILAADPRLERLPEEVRAFRRAAAAADHLGNYLTLVCDNDPDRRPPPPRLGEPVNLGTHP